MQVPFKEHSLIVPQELVPWPKGRAERASINSFGLGGANAHVILDSTSSFTGPSHGSNGHTNGGTNGHSAIARPTNASCDVNLLVLSANRPESLDSMVKNIRKYAATHADSLSDLAYTLAVKRDTMRHRTCLLLRKTPEDGHNKTDDINFPSAKTASPSPVSFVFTGQGAQWPQMGQELFAAYPTFAARITDLDTVLEKIQPQGSTWSIRGKCSLDTGGQ